MIDASRDCDSNPMFAYGFLLFAFCVKMISYGNSVKTCIFQLFKCGSPIACMSVKKKKSPTCSMKELLGGTPDGITL